MQYATQLLQAITSEALVVISFLSEHLRDKFTSVSESPLVEE